MLNDKDVLLAIDEIIKPFQLRTAYKFREHYTVWVKDYQDCPKAFNRLLAERLGKEDSVSVCYSKLLGVKIEIAWGKIGSSMFCYEDDPYGI